MPAPQRRFAAAILELDAIADGVETVCATTAPVSSSFPGCCYLVEFNVAYHLGGNATSLTLQIRRGGLTGDLFDPIWTVGSIDTTALQGAAACSIVDQSAQDAAGIVWVLTATPAGDTVDITGGTASVTVDVGGRPSTLD
jgi:hypothetical protein